MGRPEGSAGPPQPLAAALLALALFSTGVCSLSQPLPRVFLSFEDLQASQSFEHYSISEKAMDYRILQMDEDQDRMYVGCKDHVLSMDINNITLGTLKVSWPASPSKVEECQMAGKDPTHGCGNFIRVVQPYNRTHLFMCGSGAYSPVCVYVNRGRRPEEQVFHIDSRTESGKGRCSFNPQVNTASVMISQAPSPPSPSLSLSDWSKGVGLPSDAAKGDTLHPRLCFPTSEHGRVSSRSVCQLVRSPTRGGWKNRKGAGRKTFGQNGVEVGEAATRLSKSLLPRLRDGVWAR